VIDYLLTLIVILFTSIGQLLLKIGTIRASNLGGQVYTNPVSIAGYLVFAFVAFVSIYAMKGLDMKVFFALNSLTYICIPILAYVILKESFTKNKTIGIIIISIGVILFNL
jgi:drug/metabolite transporter (DMT)-like permease